MSKLDQLFKSLSSLKQDLAKNVNTSYSGDINQSLSTANMSKEEQKANLNNPYFEEAHPKTKESKRKDGLDLADPEHPFGESVQKASVDPKLAPKERKMKELQSKIDAGQYKPDPKKIADKMVDIAVKKGEECLKIDEKGQWQLKKWNLEKRCWEGYKPTPGKEAYEKGSCQPVKKDDSEIAPKGSNNKETFNEAFGKAGDPLKAELTPEKGVSQTGIEVRRADPRKKGIVSHGYGRITSPEKHGERAKQYAKDTLEALKQQPKPKLTKSYEVTEDLPIANNEIEMVHWDSGDLDFTAGDLVDIEMFNTVCENICKSLGYEELEKKEWSPKAEHKSDKGGLTEAGRKSYNKATGGNLKAPQPGGGPRKRSFCARNKGQIDMHNIDCKKTPEKRACKARRRWKC